MSEAKHTPGPWLLGNEFEDDTELSIINDDDHRICEIGPFLQEWTDEERANALLIAAAPEMLEALKRVAYEDDRKRGFYFVIHQTIMQQVKAAIAKAEGRNA
jgi:hypothetical protein